EGGAKDVGRQEAQEQTKPPAAVDEELGNAGAVGRFQKRGQGQAKREEAEQNDGQLERGEDAKSPPEKAADGGCAEGLGSCGKLIGRGSFPRSRRLRNGPDGTRWVEQLGWGHGLSRREKREGIEVPGNDARRNDCWAMPAARSQRAGPEYTSFVRRRSRPCPV